VNDKLAWYVSRSSGWVAFFLLAVTVVWGILGITKVIERKGLPRWMMDLHKYVALLTMIFVGIHLGALVADNFTHIAWREILIPYAFDWKPGAVTFGIVAFYLLVAVQVSSWLRPRLPRKLWKATHMLSYPAMWLVAMHGLKAGTDASNLALRVSVMVVVGLTSFFTLLRVLMGRTARRTAAPTVVRIVFPAPIVEVEPEPASYVVHVQEAMDSLRDALQRMQQANAEPELLAERRREARTLVDDVPPSL
jgi:DMSO/TMAO reductase YedYZ heme-binding membrane subunit